VEEAVPAAEQAAPADDGARKNRKENAPAEAPPAESIPIPDPAVAAMDNAGDVPDIYLPPAPLDPMPPSQAFLPVTPTPVSDGTPTPEAEPQTQADAPQLAEDTSGNLGVTALAPEPPGETTVNADEVRTREKRDRSSKGGKSREQEQVAYFEEPMSWSAGPIELQQTVAEPIATEVPIGESAVAPDAAMTETEPVQIDPITGFPIDPVWGLPVDPSTGYLIDVVNGRIIDPRTGFLVHPMTGLLIDPATGAQLDPVTLAIVIPAGFGDDQPAYVPGSPEMRGQIETVVDDTYDNSTYKVIPPTDGPVQPVGEIVVPTESGDALEIS
jgi:hypothetical protein